MPTFTGRCAKTLALLFVCGISSFYLVGCATCPIEYTQQSKLPSGEGLVCGRVTTLRGNQPVVWESGAFATSGMQVYVMPESGGVNIPYVLRGDGRFCWHLRPGRYVISSFERQAGTRFESGRIWAEFTVPSAGSQTCLGTLVIQFSEYRYKYGVLDGCDQIVADLKTNKLGVADEWQTQLLVLEPSK